jgi:hypothetical protein
MGLASTIAVLNPASILRGGIMSWCDKLASTPTVGLIFKQHYAPSSTILASLSPLLDSWTTANKSGFSLDKYDAFSVEFTSEDGFHYAFDPMRISVDFKYRLRMRSVSAGPPVVEMLSHPKPFTHLLPEVCKRLIYATSLVMPMKTRAVEKVGIVSLTTVDDKDAPPGIAKFLTYMSRPWKTTLDHFGMQITANLASTPMWSDRCIHQLNKVDNPDALMTLSLDWQRTYSSPTPVIESDLKELIQSCQAEALKYFEDLAVGDRFDG